MGLCAAICTLSMQKQQSGDALCQNTVVRIGPIGPCTLGTPTGVHFQGVRSLNFIESWISQSHSAEAAYGPSLWACNHEKRSQIKSMCSNTVALHTSLHVLEERKIFPYTATLVQPVQKKTHTASVQTVSNWEKLACWEVMCDGTCCIAFLEATPIFSTYVVATSCISTTEMQKPTRNNNGTMIVMWYDNVKYNHTNAWSASARQDVRVATAVYGSMGLHRGLQKCVSL